MFDFNIYNKSYKDKNDIMLKESSGIVKGKKAFPIYKDKLFKPLSKTKPLTTPLFGISEVFWSTIIHNYFDDLAPIYQLGICNGYSKDFKSRYEKGTFVNNVLKDKEYLVNLLEYYNLNPSQTVNIKDYINYCGLYYDYTNILKDLPATYSKELSYQVLISILKNDINYHYENIAFIYENNKIKKLAPPIDHEFSAFFLYPDSFIHYSNYFGGMNYTLINNAEESYIHFENIIKNINVIQELYPDTIKKFLINLKQFINDFSKYKFLLPNNYMEPFNTDLYQVYEAIYKEHEASKNIYEIEKFKLNELNTKEYSNKIQNDILLTSSNLYKRLNRL